MDAVRRQLWMQSWSVEAGVCDCVCEVERVWVCVCGRGGWSVCGEGEGVM